MSDLQEQQGGGGSNPKPQININKYAKKLYGTDIQKVSDVVSIINNKMNNITPDKSYSIIFTFKKNDNNTYEVLKYLNMKTWYKQEYTFLTNDNIETQLLEHLVPSDKLVVTFAFDSKQKKWGITKIGDGFSSSNTYTTIEDKNPTPQTNLNSEGVRAAIERIRSENMVAAKMKAEEAINKKQIENKYKFVGNVAAEIIKEAATKKAAKRAEEAEAAKRAEEAEAAKRAEEAEAAKRAEEAEAAETNLMQLEEEASKKAVSMIDLTNTLNTMKGYINLLITDHTTTITHTIATVVNLFYDESGGPNMGILLQIQDIINNKNVTDKVIYSLMNAVKRLNTYGDNNTMVGNIQTNMKEHAAGLYIIIDRIINVIQDPTKIFQPIVKQNEITKVITEAIISNKKKNNIPYSESDIETIVKKNTKIEYPSYDYSGKTENKKKKGTWIGGRKTQKRNKKKRPNNCLFRKSVKNRK